MRIGELAEKTGVPVRTIRYYEDIGLLGTASRTESGYRLFTDRHQQQLAFIRAAQGLGLRLEQIRRILASASTEHSPCPCVRSAVEQNMQELDDRIVQLQAMRDNLSRTLYELDNAEHSDGSLVEVVCPAIESLNAGTPEVLDSPVEWRR
ncbi:MAG: MerR family transcriptional regulator [Sphaerobacteraceae bacterium]|nr:MAG: MerR family transcriptional regulator [Sphaerobacteraceae bacterium]